MKRILAGVLMGFLVLVSASQFASAQTCGCSDGSGKSFRGEGSPMMSPMRHDGMGMKRKGHHLWKALKSLGLDEKQNDAIKEIHARVTKDTIMKRADIAVARIELKELLSKDQVDLSAAEATLKKIASLHTDIRFGRIKAMQEVKSKLTPEQRKKFKEMSEVDFKTGKMKHD